MPPRLSGSTEWDVGRGDDSKDPAGVFSGQEADQANLPGTAGIAEYGAEGDPVWCDGSNLRTQRSASAKDRAMERQARRDVGGECEEAKARAVNPHPDIR